MSYNILNTQIFKLNNIDKKRKCRKKEYKIIYIKNIFNTENNMHS